MSVGAHLAGAPEVSTELGDAYGATYGQNPLDYKDLVNRSYAGGVTQVVIHGFAYSDAPGAPWPGWSPFGVISEPWSRHHPQWRDWPAFATYMGRARKVLEAGEPALDVAVYHDDGIDPLHETSLAGFPGPSGPETRPLFGDQGLQRAGYTYEYVDPEALGLPAAERVRGRLFGDGPAYQALILDGQTAMPVAAARAIVQQARRGLRVVVVGAPPERGAGMRDDDAEVRRAMAELLALPSAARVDAEADVPAALRGLGVEQAARFPRPLPLLTVRRRTPTTEYWYVLNPSASPVTSTVAFATRGAPEALDLWNGTASRIVRYRATQAGVEVPLALPAHGDTVLAFRRGVSRPHVVDTDAEEVVAGRRGIVVRDTRGGTRHVRLSDGRVRRVDLGRVPAPLQLDRWRLHVEEARPVGSATHDLTLDGLRDWRAIEALKDASGVGRYTTTVGWGSRRRGAFLDVGDVQGSMRVRVNGTPVTRQTVPGGRWSIGPLLRRGANEIEIEVATTLRNRIVALAAGGDPRYAAYEALPTQPYGLLGPVRLIPFGQSAL